MYSKLLELKINGFIPSNILDIGCNVGEFSIECKKVWNQASIYMIEANKKCEKFIKNISSNYYLEVLSYEDNIDVDFYMTKDDELCTGNSLYLENTKHYAEDKIIVEKRKTKKLDTLFPNISFDLIKIDVQGAEIDVINGGLATINNAEYIIIETSIKEYNKNAPLENKTISTMQDIGFKNFKEIEAHFYPTQDHEFIKQGEIFQRDLIFYR